MEFKKSYPEILSIKISCYNFFISKLSKPTRNHLVSGLLRNELKELACNSTNLSFPRDILLCDQVHRTIIVNEHAWTHLTLLDLSKNQITHLDEALALAPNLEVLNLESNNIETISHLQSLTKLRCLNLNRNQITDLTKFRTELNAESLQELSLSENRICTLQGLNGLTRLQSLDLGSNFISDLDEIANINTLEQLTNLNLTGNPIATIIDYRIKILQLFFNRADQLVLDSEKPTLKEIDCTRVLNALIMAANS